MTRRAPDEVDALLLLGQTHLDNHRPRDAFDCFRDAARSGRAAALNMLGRCHERGWGVARDAALAARLFRAAAEGGEPWAMFNLADLLWRGDGCEKDAEAAFRFYEAAARGGVGKALNMLGLFHENGEVVAKDRDAALAFFEAGAEGGDCWAAFNLARCLAADGRHEAARAWLLRARETGFPDFVDAAQHLAEAAIARECSVP